jgi:VanZ family protein
VLLVAGSTVLLELLQLVQPSRHGRIVDVLVKLIGAGFGLGAGAFVARLMHKI